MSDEDQTRAPEDPTADLEGGDLEDADVEALAPILGLTTPPRGEPVPDDPAAEEPADGESVPGQESDTQEALESIPDLTGHVEAYQQVLDALTGALEGDDGGSDADEVGSDGGEEPA